MLYNIEELPLSVRALNCLKSIPVSTISELLAVDTAKLARTRNLGRKTLREINDLLCDLHARRSPGTPAGEEIPLLPAREEPGLTRPRIGTEDCRYPWLLFDIVELNLSPRAMNALRKADICRVGDVVSRTGEELLRIRSLGSKSLKEIRKRLSALGLDVGGVIASWPPEGTQRQHATGDSQARGLIRAVPEKTAFLEDELAGILQHYARNNNRDMLGRLLGWDGKGEKTLRSVGQEYGYTREWVRQVRMQFESMVRHSSILRHSPLPALGKALKCIKENLPAEERTIMSRLVSLGVTQSLFNLDGVVTACAILGRKMPFSLREFRGRRFIMAAGAEIPPKKVVACAVNSVRRYGLASVRDVLANLRETLGWQGDTAAIVPLLLSREDFQWLDERKGWFWYARLGNNRLRKTVKKMLSVSSRIDIAELRMGIDRYLRMDELAPPQAVLTEFCRQLPFCRVNGRRVIADPPLIWEKELKGTSERRICAIFKEKKTLMTYEELERECLNLGMSLSAFNAQVFTSPIVIRYAHKTYGLVGTKVLPGVIDRAPSQGANKKCRVEFGWTENGRIWIARELTRGDFMFGSFYIPASLRYHVAGEYRVKLDHNRDMGTLTVKGRMATDMRHLYSRLGAEPGDHIILLYDLSLREVRVYRGDEGECNRLWGATAALTCHPCSGAAEHERSKDHA